MVHPKAKDLIYRTIPLGLLQQALPRVAASRSPFLPEIVDRKVIFIHIPKAAGSSLKTELYGAPTGGHRRIVEYAAYDGPKTRDFFKVSFVRNPWDRLLSAYSYLKNRTATSYRDRSFASTFLDQTEDINAFVLALEDRKYRRAVMLYDHFRPQGHWICMPGARNHAMDFIGRFETMEADMAALRDRLALPPGAVAKTRASQHLPYREAYTRRARDLVADIYARDIALLDYSF